MVWGLTGRAGGIDHSYNDNEVIQDSEKHNSVSDLERADQVIDYKEKEQLGISNEALRQLQEEIVGDPPTIQREIITSGLPIDSHWKHSIGSLEDLLEDNEKGIITLNTMVDWEEQPVEFTFQNRKGISKLWLLQIRNRTIASEPVMFNGSMRKLTLENKYNRMEASESDTAEWEKYTWTLMLTLHKLTWADVTSSEDARSDMTSWREMTSDDAIEWRAREPYEEPDDTMSHPFLSEYQINMDNYVLLKAPEGIKRLPQTENWSFTLLPSLDTPDNQHEYKIVWVKKHPGYIWDEGWAIQDAIKKELEHVFVDSDENRRPNLKDDPYHFGLYQYLTRFSYDSWSKKVANLYLKGSEKSTPPKHMWWLKWMYETTDREGNKLVMELTLQKTKFLKWKGASHEDVSWYVLHSDIVDIDFEVLDAWKQFRESYGIDLRDFFADFSSIPGDLKDGFYEISSKIELQKWLKEAFASMEDGVEGFVENFEKLKPEKYVEIKKVTGLYMDKSVYPMANTNTAGLDQITVKPWSIDGKNITFEVPKTEWFGLKETPTDLFTVKLPDTVSTDSYRGQYEMSEKKIKEIFDIPVSDSWTWKYEITVEEKKDNNGVLKKVVTASIKPPKEYTEYFENNVDELKEINTILSKNFETPLDTSKFNFTSPFAEKRSHWPHNWLDYAPKPSTPKNAPIQSALPWLVVDVRKRNDTRTNWSYGTYVIVQHEIDWRKFRTIYAHLDNENLAVERGDVIKAWDQISTLEYDSGQQWHSTAPHLHFELRVYDPEHQESPKPHINDKWRAINPAEFF